jgi:hypothetical protein
MGFLINEASIEPNVSHIIQKWKNGRMRMISEILNLGIMDGRKSRVAGTIWDRWDDASSSGRMR